MVCKLSCFINNTGICEYNGMETCTSGRYDGRDLMLTGFSSNAKNACDVREPKEAEILIETKQ